MLDKLLGSLGLERRAKKTANPSDFFGRTFFQATSYPLQDARSVPAVWAMLDLIASSIAALPVMVFRRDGQGVETVDLDHPVNDLLAEPDGPWNRVEAVEYWVAEAARLGTSYLRVLRGPNGRAIGWYPLLTASVSPQLAESGRIWYRVTKQAGVVGAPANELLTGEDVAVLRYRMSDDGYRGLNPSWWQSGAIATGHAQLGQDQSYASRGLRHGGIISMTGKAQPESLQALRQQFEGVFEDPKAGKVAVLDNDAKFSALNVTPRESEWVDTRNLGVQEICRVYGVPPSAIGEVSKATFSNVEEQQRQLIRSAIMPWVARAGAALSQAFLTAEERRQMRVGFRDSDLNRANLKDRSEYLSRLVQAGVMSRNEARELERLPPVAGGDQILTPLNLSPDINAVRSAPLETRELPAAVRERLRIRARFEPRFAAALEELLEGEFERLTQIMNEDRAELRLVEFYEEEIRARRFPELFTPIVLAAAPIVTRSVLEEIGEAFDETNPAHDVEQFGRSVADAMSRQFATVRQAEAGELLLLPPPERDLALEDMRRSPPRSAQHLAIRTIESYAFKVYTKNRKERLALMSTGGELLSSIDVKTAGGIDRARDKLLKHAPSRRFPDAILTAA
ncbi:MAG: phage portal protein [Alphaproteobacteria bacterium]